MTWYLVLPRSVESAAFTRFGYGYADGCGFFGAGSGSNFPPETAWRDGGGYSERAL